MVMIRRTPAIVETKIMGLKLTNTIVDEGLRVNILTKETWKALGKSTVWSPTFHLVEDRHSIKPLGKLMAQKEMVGTQPFFHHPGKEGIQCSNW